MARALGQFRDQGREVFGAAVSIVRGIGLQNFRYSLECGRLDGGGGAVVAGDEDVYVPVQLGRGADGVKGGGLEARMVVFCDYQNGHGQSLTILSLHS